MPSADSIKTAGCQRPPPKSYIVENVEDHWAITCGYGDVMGAMFLVWAITCGYGDVMFEQHVLLGSGGNQNLRPSCRRPPTRTFHTPVGTLRLDAPALV